jgi:thioredoxin-related protein
MLKRLILAFALLLPAAVAAEPWMGDDGLHKTTWMRDTFKDLNEDLAEATELGLRLMVMIEQRGCIYCTKMHEEVFTDFEIESYIEENFFVIQLNMFGDVEVTDFDGETLSEREMIMKWGVMFTPTILFFPEEVTESKPAPQLAVGLIPGALSKGMTLNMLTWVNEKVYENGENFQKYHARMLEMGRGGN